MMLGKMHRAESSNNVGYYFQVPESRPPAIFTCNASSICFGIGRLRPRFSRSRMNLSHRNSCAVLLTDQKY
jgi:hypothetical protein